MATSVPGQMSTYTRWLANYLTNAGKSLTAVFSDAGTVVIISTAKTQRPTIFSSSVTDPFLRPTEINRKEEREVWCVALDTKDRDQIQFYSHRHSVTRHAAAARRWLKENPESEAHGFTLVSPVAVERAWRPNNVSQVAVRRLETREFAFPRSMVAGWEKDVVRAADKEVGVVPTRTSTPELEIEKTGEQYLTKNWGIRSTSKNARKLAFSIASMDVHEEVVATQNLIARSKPDDKAELVSRIPAGTELQVQGLAEGPNHSVWMQILTAPEASSSFVKVDSSAVASRSVVELGQSLKEIVVKARPNSLPDLIDPKPLRDAVTELKNQGLEITWVSLATGAINDEIQQAIRDARLAHAQYLLKQMGIPGRRMTALTAVNEFKDEGVRIRFFGIRK